MTSQMLLFQCWTKRTTGGKRTKRLRDLFAGDAVVPRFAFDIHTGWMRPW